MASFCKLLSTIGFPVLRLVLACGSICKRLVGCGFWRRGYLLRRGEKAVFGDLRNPQSLCFFWCDMVCAVCAFVFVEDDFVSLMMWRILELFVSAGRDRLIHARGAT